MRFVAIILCVGACSASVPLGDSPADSATADASPPIPDEADAGSTDAAPPPDPSALIASLAAEIEAATGGEVAIAAKALSSQAILGSFNGDELHVSASSAKAYWVAAALDGVGLEPVAEIAEPIFTTSDNFAAGAVIDLIGPNAVNEFTWDVAGLDDTALTSWSFGRTRVADNSPRLLGGNNYTTAADGVRFMELLVGDELLAASETEALLEWMRMAPDQGFGGWVGDWLPESARQTLAHKSGWLPPGCCSMEYNTLVDIGAMWPEDGEPFVYAILLGYGDWELEKEAMRRAGCELHRFFAGRAESCPAATGRVPARRP